LSKTIARECWTNLRIPRKNNKAPRMYHNIHKGLGEYLPEHVQPSSPDPSSLKSAIDAANLTQIWDMILNLDYGTSDVESLSPDKQDEFLNVMSLLLKAIDR
jgi:hypothetical protein